MKKVLSFLLICCVLCSCFCSFSVCRAATIFGDLNQDGSADLKDALFLRNALVKSTTTSSMDLTKDSLVDMRDVLFLRKYLAKAIDKDGNPIRNEMRAIWVAYYEVESVLKSTPAATKTAIDTLMSNVASYGANAVIWHVRAYSEAYYKSSYFPVDPTVSPLLSAGFDPFSYVVSSAHAHGLELHAWINPYRVGSTLERAKSKDTFLFNGKYYYSPASSNVRTLVINGAKELVQNYAIDGIHLDDYFYPEGISTTAQSFDIGYTSAQGSLANWRRKQVDTLISNMYSAVHSIRSSISMGVSPGGTIAKDRDSMYADVEKWMSTKGYLDYICPQIYFGIEHQTAAFETRMNEWRAVKRASNVNLYIGIAAYKAGLKSDPYAGSGKTEWATHSDILAREVKLCRKYADVQGFMLFRYQHMTLSAFSSSENDLTIAKKEISNLIAEMKK